MNNEYSDIAIVGMACKFPGADNLNEYWKNITDGVSSITYFSENESQTGNADLKSHKNYVKASGRLDGIENFDAEFFGFSSSDAAIMDPQHRLALECSYHALENAGLLNNNNERTGVFAGCGFSTYLLNNVHPATGMYANRTFLESANELKIIVGNDKDYLATRISYKFNLQGPSMTVQTACSTSLVAVHMAIQSILNGECTSAIAGGVNVLVPQNSGYLYQEDMMFSPDGICRPFDEQAKGTVFGSGVGIVVLKKLNKAIEDKDHIYAIIKGTAVNNDGSQKAGFTAPSVAGQQDAIQEALDFAQVDPASIGYVEAHGTGTILGDPLEIRSLTNVYSSYTTKKEYCAIGSVKANIGHLSWAAGIAGLIKTALCLYHKTIPPQINFSKANPKINFPQTPFYVNTNKIYWDTETIRTAAISAFGIGGTNAHAILQEYIPDGNLEIKSDRPNWEIVTVSSKNENTLIRQVHALNEFLIENRDTPLRKIAVVNNLCKKYYPNRAAFIVHNMQELRTQLEDILLNNSSDADLQHIANMHLGIDGNHNNDIVFLFTGQGSQYWGMGLQLFEANPTFRKTFKQCDQQFQKYAAKSLIDILYVPENDQSLIHQIQYTQVAIFAFEYSLAKCYIELGILPDVVIGHSTGEYVAACISEIFSLEEGIWLCMERGRLMNNWVSANGLMVSVIATKLELEETIEPFSNEVSIAAINGRLSTVISGTKDAIEKIIEILADKQFKWKVLEIDRAGHSPLMEAMLSPFSDVLNQLSFKQPKIKIISNLTGESNQTTDFTVSEYWTRHTREPVLFYDGISRLISEGYSSFLEIGPDPSLLGLISASYPDHDLVLIPTLTRASKNDVSMQEKEFMTSVAELYINGFNINWSNFYQNSEYKSPPPSYNFNKQRYWIDEPLVTERKGVDPSILARTNVADTGDRHFNIRWELSSQASALVTSGLIRNRYCLLVANMNFSNSEKKFWAERYSNCLFVVLNEDFISNTLQKIIASFPNKDFEVIFITCPIEKSSLGSAFYENTLKQTSLALELIQQLVKKSNGEFGIYLISVKAQKILETDEIIDLFSTVLAGLFKSVQLESPEILFRHIDLDQPIYKLNPGTHRASIFSAADISKYLGLRNGLIYHPVLTKLASVNRTDFKPPKDGIYIISGGLGGLGKLISETLGEAEVHKVMLIGRSKLNEEYVKYINSYQSIYTTRLSYQNCDVSDVQQMEELFIHLSHSNVPILGIFHAAGNIKDATLLNQSRDSLEITFLPKILGTINLHELTIRYAPELKIFVTFSSIVSIIGNQGQSNHGAANAFLDSLTYYRRSHNLPSNNINWGAWSEIGSLKDKPEVKIHLRSIGFGMITNEEGIRSLKESIMQNYAQLIVMPMDWESYFEAYPIQKAPFFYPILRDKIKSITERNNEANEKLLHLTEEEKKPFITNAVKDIINSIIGYKNSQTLIIDDDRRIFDYGVDSLTSIQIRSKLKKRFELDLKPTFIFDYSTVRKIVAYIEEHLVSIKSDEIITPSPGDLAPQFIEQLSPQQSRWLKLIENGYGFRVVPIIFNYLLDTPKFITALKTVIERHRSLRYFFKNGKVEVISSDDMDLLKNKYLFTDISRLTVAEKAIVLGDYCAKMYNSKQKTEVGISWGIQAFKLEEEKFTLMLSMQHIDFDGTSLTNFANELQIVYEALLYDNDIILPSCVQYDEYIEWHNQYRQAEIKIDRAFFQGVFASNFEATLLTPGITISRTIPKTSKRHTEIIERVQFKTLISLAKEKEVSLFSIIFSAYAMAIGDTIKKEEVLISIITNGRPDERFLSTIGPFTAPFPVLVNIKNRDLTLIAQNVNLLITQINARSHYPVADLTDHIDAFANLPSDTYFTDVGINFTNYKREKKSGRVKILEILGPTSEQEFLECPPSELTRIPGLHLVINELSDSLLLNFWYHEDRFSVAYVNALYNIIHNHLFHSHE